MLVLSRKPNEEVLIAGEIRVRVLELRGGRVRLGISAPPEISVDRAEIALRNCFDTGGENEFGTAANYRQHSMSLRAG